MFLNVNYSLEIYGRAFKSTHFEVKGWRSIVYTNTEVRRGEAFSPAPEPPGQCGSSVGGSAAAAVGPGVSPGTRLSFGGVVGPAGGWRVTGETRAKVRFCTLSWSDFTTKRDARYGGEMLAELTANCQKHGSRFFLGGYCY